MEEVTEENIEFARAARKMAHAWRLGERGDMFMFHSIAAREANTLEEVAWVELCFEYGVENDASKR